MKQSKATSCQNLWPIWNCMYSCKWDCYHTAPWCGRVLRRRYSLLPLKGEVETAWALTQMLSMLRAVEFPGIDRYICFRVILSGRECGQSGELHWGRRSGSNGGHWQCSQVWERKVNGCLSQLDYLFLVVSQKLRGNINTSIQGWKWIHIISVIKNVKISSWCCAHLRLSQDSQESYFVVSCSSFYGSLWCHEHMPYTCPLVPPLFCPCVHWALCLV